MPIGASLIVDSRAVLLHAAEEARHAPVVADAVLLIAGDVATLPVTREHALLIILQGCEAVNATAASPGGQKGNYSFARWRGCLPVAVVPDSRYSWLQELTEEEESGGQDQDKQ